MNSGREYLFRPVLDSAQQKTAPYSIRATLLTSFFGGPFAAIAMIAANAYRLTRVKREWLTILVISLFYVLGVRVLLHSTPGVFFVRQWMQVLGDRNLLIFYRLIALIICGYGYLLHRREHRATTLTGMDSPNPWPVALGCGLAGGGLQFLFLTWING